MSNVVPIRKGQVIRRNGARNAYDEQVERAAVALAHAHLRAALQRKRSQVAALQTARLVLGVACMVVIFLAA